MSQQQMNFDEANRQQQEPPFENYEAGYRDPFMGSLSGQKLSSQPVSSGGASAGMRLALAIVSLGILVPIVAIVLGISLGTSGASALPTALLVLGLVCFTIISVNVAFNYRH